MQQPPGEKGRSGTHLQDGAAVPASKGQVVFTGLGSHAFSYSILPSFITWPYGPSKFAASVHLRPISILGLRPHPMSSNLHDGLKIQIESKDGCKPR